MPIIKPRGKQTEEVNHGLPYQFLLLLMFALPLAYKLRGRVKRKKEVFDVSELEELFKTIEALEKRLENADRESKNR